MNNEIKGTMLVFESLPSTNKWMLDNIASLKSGDVVRAVTQTAGYGRFGRKWFSADDRSLTMSVAIKPPATDDTNANLLGPLAALAVRAMLERHSIPASLKWPNDVLVDGRKIAGILIERDSRASAWALGIGVNVNVTESDFAKLDLLQPAVSMSIVRGITFDVGHICDDIIAEFQNMTGNGLLPDFEFIRDNWERHDALTGRTITVQTADCELAGKYSGMDKDGRLRLVDLSGKEHLLWSGDVSISGKAS